MTKLKKSVVVLIVLASVLALSAFFYTDYYSSTEKLETDEIFLESYGTMAFRHDNLDQAHILGEPFYLTVVVQYKADLIEIFPESLDHADYRPLEPTGNKSVKLESMDVPGKNIEQLTYSIELVAVQAIPGESYEIPKMLLEFKRKNSDSRAKYTLDVVPPVGFHIGSYWGANYEGARLRPMKGKIVSATAEKQILYNAGSAIFLLSGLVLAGALVSGAVRKKIKTESLFGSKTRTFEVFGKYSDINWLKLKSASERMHELESFVFSLSEEHGLVQNSAEFWAKDNARWSEMLDLFETAYSKAGIDYDRVVEASYLAKELIVRDTLQNTGRNRLFSLGK